MATASRCLPVPRRSTSWKPSPKNPGNIQLAPAGFNSRVLLWLANRSSPPNAGERRLDFELPRATIRAGHRVNVRLTQPVEHDAAAGIPPATRNTAIDAVRGVVMVVMALDHVRDFVHAGAMSFSPEDLSRTTPPIF